MTKPDPKDELDELIEKLLPRTNCPASCDGFGTYAEDDGYGNPEPAQCQWCDEVVMPLRAKLKTLIAERERVARIDTVNATLHYIKNDLDQTDVTERLNSWLESFKSELAQLQGGDNG